MNERIQKLAEQCRTEYRNCFVGYIEQIDEEKFAKLIIKECANICFSEAAGHSMVFGAHSVGTKFGEHCGVVIKEHFGVE